LDESGATIRFEYLFAQSIELTYFASPDCKSNLKETNVLM